MILTGRSAKEFLVAQIVDEAGRRGIPLSDVEEKMLFFSEMGGAQADMAGVLETFNREYDEAVFERKIVSLLRGAHKRLDANHASVWTAAVERLADGDHYMSALLAQAHIRPRGDWLRLVVTAFAVSVVGMLVIGGLNWLAGPDAQRDTIGFYAWVVASACAGVYAVARWAFGAARIDGLVANWIELFTRKKRRRHL